MTDPYGRPVDPNLPSYPPYGAAPQFPTGQYPTGPYPTEPYPPQQYPGQPHSGQPYPAQPYAGQPYPPQPAYGMPGYPGPGYPPGYPGYGPYAPAQAARPGVVVAASVLSFVVAGLLFIAALLLFLGASVVSGLSESLDRNSTTTITEILLDGLIDMISGGLLLAGGIVVLGRRANGRTLYSIGAGACIAAGIYWLVRAHDSGVVPFFVLFVAPTVTGLVLLWLSSVTRWLRGY
jgi:hypothetical protein